MKFVLQEKKTFNINLIKKMEKEKTDGQMAFM